MKSCSIPEEQQQQQQARALPTFCADCKKYLCTDDDHKIHESAFPEHVTSVQERIFRDDCPKHPGNVFEFYCPQHELLCCAECKDKLHCGCAILDITRVDANKAKRDFHEIIERLEKELDAIKRGGSSIVSRHTEFEKSFSSMKNEITSIFNAARTALDAREKDLLDELDAFYKETGQPEIERRITELSRTEGTLADGKKFFQEPWTESKKKEMLMRLCNIKNEDASFTLLEDSVRDLPTINFHYDKSLVEETIGKFGEFFVSKRINPEKINIENVTPESFTVSWPPHVSMSKYIRAHYEAELSPADKNSFKQVYSGSDTKFTVDGLLNDTTYNLRLRSVPDRKDCKESCDWSGLINVKTSWKWTCGWKECPSNVTHNKMYTVEDSGKRTVISKLVNGDWCTAISDTPLPAEGITRWGIELLGENSGSIFVGVAPSDIDQNDDKNINKCGWYFDCCDLTLWSGLPHLLYHEEYGSKKYAKQRIHKGDIIGVNIDLPKGDLSFAVNSTNLGIAYKEIPLDKPLVPCVLLRWKNDSIKLIFN